MFPTTLPAGEPELMRVSAFQRYLDELSRADDAGPASSRLSLLSPSLMSDLVRFERDGQQSEVLEVLAASMRHVKALTVHLQQGDRVVPLTMFPQEKLAYTPLPMTQFLSSRLTELRVLQVEPAMLRPPGWPDRLLVGDPQRYAPLGPVLWHMALRGARDTLLPEIAGVAAYRVVPSGDLAGIRLKGALAAAVERLRRQTTNLKDLAAWPGLDRERACRLLNGLYLHALLIVSRTHPAATNDGWFGYR